MLVAPLAHAVRRRHFVRVQNVHILTLRESCVRGDIVKMLGCLFSVYKALSHWFGSPRKTFASKQVVPWRPE